MKSVNAAKKTSDIVKDDLKSADIFEKYNIDFCCGGNISIAEACEASGIDVQQLVSELENRTGTDPDAQYISQLSQAGLCDYIEQKHHAYVEQNIPVLKQYLEKVCSVHGDNHPELHEINELFNQSAGNLAQHMKKEELVLFPFIRRMEQFKTKVTPAEQPHFGHVSQPIAMMREEHENEGARFSKINKLSGGYTPPTDACNTYRVTLFKLDEFEKDLHRHIHLENNILFPKAEESFNMIFGS